MAWRRCLLVGIRRNSVRLELSDSGGAGDRHLLPPAPAQAPRRGQELAAAARLDASAGGAGGLIFKDVAADGAAEPRSAAAAAKCRQILADLLRPLGADAEGRAEALIDEFGSLGAVLAAGEPGQARVLGRGAEGPRLLAAVRAAMLHVLREPALHAAVIADSRALIDYLSVDMAHLPVERLRILFLNAKNRLLGDEAIDGSVDAIPVYPREIMRRALELGATAMILAHNHPSGDPDPSADDIQATRRIAYAADGLGIRVHDHVIVAGGGWTSFRARGLLAA